MNGYDVTQLYPYVVAYYSKALDQQFMKAVTEGKVADVQTLLKAGANVNAITVGTHDEHTALTVAALYGYSELVTVLLRAGANPNIRQSGSVWTPTPLMLAAASGHSDIAQMLLAGVELEPTDLFSAIFEGHVDVARLLFRAGANPRWTFSDGKTVLQVLVCPIRSTTVSNVRSGVEFPEFSGQTLASGFSRRGD